jgi:hypothetical protein
MPNDHKSRIETVTEVPVYFAHLLDMLTVFRSEYERCPPPSQAIRHELMDALMGAASEATYYAEEDESRAAPRDASLPSRERAHSMDIRRAVKMTDHDRDDRCLACAARDILWNLPPMERAGVLADALGGTIREGGKPERLADIIAEVTARITEVANEADDEPTGAGH